MKYSEEISRMEGAAVVCVFTADGVVSLLFLCHADKAARAPGGQTISCYPCLPNSNTHARSFRGVIS